MDDLSAPMPRHVRVRAAILLPVVGLRVSATTFLLVAGFFVMGALAVVAGADVTTLVPRVGVLMVLGVLGREGHLWGRTLPTVARLVLRHLRPPYHLRLTPVWVILPPDSSEVSPMDRRPRWQVASTEQPSTRQGAHDAPVQQ